MEPTLLTSRDDSVATVTIHNPAKRNAMTPDMWHRLPALLHDLAADSTVRALVLTGAEDTFCAGADIGALRAPADGGSAQAQQGMTVAAEEALAAFPKPTLAAVRGYCVGGGCQLAVACDLRFASESARLGITPAKLGIVYAASSTERLVRLVGPSAAKYLLFSGELIDAARALRTGLVDEVHPEKELAGRVAEFARKLTTRSALTQAAAKEFADGRTGPDRVAHWQREAAAGGEAAEGVDAFLEQRVPRFGWPRTEGRSAR